MFDSFSWQVKRAAKTGCSCRLIEYVQNLQISIDLSHIPTNNGVKLRSGWTKIQSEMDEIVILVLLFMCTKVECRKGLQDMFWSQFKQYSTVVYNCQLCSTYFHSETCFIHDQTKHISAQCEHSIRDLKLETGTNILNTKGIKIYFLRCLSFVCFHSLLYPNQVYRPQPTQSNKYK